MSYPSEYFELTKDRPPLPVATISDVQMNYYRNQIVDTLKSAGRLNPEIVYSYLLGFCQRNEETLEENWESFNLVLEPGKITPLHLFKHTPYDPPDVQAVEGEATAKSDTWIMLALMGIYRLKSINRADQQSEIADRLQVLLSEFTSLKIHYGAQDSIYQTGKIRRLVAGLDMFYFRFRMSPNAVIRFGTIVSRYKDCAILATVMHGMDFLGIKDEIGRWMFSARAADEYASVMKKGNELGHEGSYTPYLSDMGLCQRSPYSASANPIMHLTIHMTCAYLGSVRSQRARIKHHLWRFSTK